MNQPTNPSPTSPTNPALSVACPRCGRRQPKRAPNTIYRCDGPHACGAMFDDNPDEGGSHDDRNPAARLEREEWRQEARQRRASGQDRNQTAPQQRAERVLRGVRRG